MKTISAELQAHLAQECTALATCWHIERRDGTVLGFTDHDHDIVVGGVKYLAKTGFTPTAVDSSATLAVDNLDIEGVIDAAVIREEDIHAGKYDYAEITIFMVNYEDIGQGTLSLRRGWMGEVAINRGQFVAEVRGISQQLSQVIGELYSPLCRAEFGDTRCKVSLAAYTVTGAITAVTSRLVFEDSSRTEDAGYFNAGKVTFSSGDNNGISMEVKSFFEGELMLSLPMPYAMEVGDSYTLSAGCDKTLETCKATFGNVINFRGEPHVPGTDKMLETAATRRTE